MSEGAKNHWYNNVIPCNNNAITMLNDLCQRKRKNLKATLPEVLLAQMRFGIN